MDSNQDEDRITSLETLLAYQEKTISEMNEVLTEQVSKIEFLISKVTKLEEALKNGTASPIKDLSEESPPPHY